MTIFRISEIIALYQEKNAFVPDNHLLISNTLSFWSPPFVELSESNERAYISHGKPNIFRFSVSVEKCYTK